MIYEVGQVVDKFKNHQEGVLFDVADDGATMIAFFKKPSGNEISQFQGNFEIRLTELYGIIMMTFKIGHLNWMDAPYSPHLSKHLTILQPVENNKGLSLNIILVDAATGEIKTIRLVGLSESFTKSLFKAIKEQNTKEFNVTEYSNTLNRIYSTYSTNHIVKLSTSYCKFQSNL